MLEYLLTPWARSGVVLVLLFLVLGFSDGWSAAVRVCLALAHTASLMGLMVRTIDAESPAEAATDRGVWLFTVLSIALGLALYVLAGPRELAITSSFGAGVGAILGLAMRFGRSKAGRRLERSERRFFRRVGKQWWGKWRRPKDT